MPSDDEYVGLTKGDRVSSKRYRSATSLWTLLLLTVMLLVAVALVILPPALSKANDFSQPPEATQSDPASKMSQSDQISGVGQDDPPSENEQGDQSPEIEQSDQPLGKAQREQPPKTAKSSQPLTSDGVSPTVTLKKYGVIRGIYENGVLAFHGVPFAEPPLGELRWRPPQHGKPWRPDILDASKRKAACLQNPSSIITPEPWISEDCLYLEIYAPIDLAASRATLPVFFYIHGGAYKSYSAVNELLDGSSFVHRTGAIVVIPNYRLGAMGFLVHGTRHNIQGNYGLLDQVFALKWVHDNIAAFEGDPSKVTLAGQSAGAQAAIIHLMSKENSKYFRSIILESPPVPLPVKAYSQGLAQTVLVAKHVNCPGDITGGDGMKCLRNVSGEAILRAQKMIKSFGELYLDRPELWGPVVDEKLVRGPLLRGFQDAEEVPLKPIMWGVTSEEALVFIREIHHQPSGFLMYAYAKLVFKKLGVDSKRLSNLYPMGFRDTRTIISNMFTDFLFRCPTEWAINQMKTAVPTVWTYVFERAIKIPPTNPANICSEHACHGINIPFLFNTFDAFNASASKVDETISRHLNYYYGNFIFYGNPNGKLMLEDKLSQKSKIPYWPRSYEDKDKYQNMVFQGDGSLDIGGRVRKDRCDFWYKRYP